MYTLFCKDRAKGMSKLLTVEKILIHYCPLLDTSLTLPERQ